MTTNERVLRAFYLFVTLKNDKWARHTEAKAAGEEWGREGSGSENGRQFRIDAKSWTTEKKYMWHGTKQSQQIRRLNGSCEMRSLRDITKIQNARVYISHIYRCYIA